MAVPSLKKSHPQKYYCKAICGLAYYLGMGDIWYEKTETSCYIEKFYTIWAVVANTFIFLGVIDESLSYFRSDLTYKEKNDVVQFSIAHPVICCKIVTLYLSKDRIKVVLQRLIDGSRSIFSSMELEKVSVKLYRRHCLTVIVISYMTLFSTSIAAIRTHLIEDIPIRTEVVYFPKPSDTGILINVIRFFVELHWYFIVSMMLTIDCLALCSLITVGHKFRVLRLYLSNMGIKILENKEKKSRKELEEQFQKEFMTAIQLHADALWCARNVQSTMGLIYSIQVFESVALLVMCLIKLVGERNVFYFLANFAFFSCVVMLTGSYMIAAGDITHEASLIATSIFHCGWELCLRSDLRTLVVVALQMSQMPIYMTAFGMITLSHTNFISILRSSYSFFAVMY